MSESKRQAAVTLLMVISIFVGVGGGWTIWAMPQQSDTEWLRVVCVGGLALIALSGIGAVVRLGRAIR